MAQQCMSNACQCSPMVDVGCVVGPLLAIDFLPLEDVMWPVDRDVLDVTAFKRH